MTIGTTDPTASAWPDPEMLLSAPSMIELERGAIRTRNHDPKLDMMVPAEKLVALFALARRTDADLATTAREHEAAGDARVIAMREAAVCAARGHAIIAQGMADNDVGENSRSGWQTRANAFQQIAMAIDALPLPKPTDALAAVVAEAVVRTLADEALLKSTLRELTRKRLEASGEMGGTRHLSPEETAAWEAVSPKNMARAAERDRKRRARGSRGDGSV